MAVNLNPNKPEGKRRKRTYAGSDGNEDTINVEDAQRESAYASAKVAELSNRRLLAAAAEAPKKKLKVAIPASATPTRILLANLEPANPRTACSRRRNPNPSPNYRLQHRP